MITKEDCKSIKKHLDCFNPPNFVANLDHEGVNVLRYAIYKYAQPNVLSLNSNCITSCCITKASQQRYNNDKPTTTNSLS